MFQRLLAPLTGAAFVCGLLLTNTVAVFASENVSSLKLNYRRPAEIPFPKDNPYVPEKAALGKALYFDPRLSGNQNMTCASCHNPSFGWEVPLKAAVGSQNTPLARNAPTVLNMAWVGPHFYWDGRAGSLEEQAKGPIEADVEMNMPLPKLVKRLNEIPEYKKWFEKVFKGEGITPDTIAKAIATYERTVVSGYAPFDAWIEGDEKAISESAKNGFLLFNTKARCVECHSGWNFTDNKFHDIGVDTTDIGRAKIDSNDPKSNHAFKTPGLRDITQRGPYMHNGSIPDLETVIVYYAGAGIERPSRSHLIKPLDLSASEIQDLIEFLKTLTGTKQNVSLPILPN